jgi:glycosyltransferase involved in cell wall biosynthesis
MRDEGGDVEPVLSVIIPAYNQGRYLVDCVKSIRECGVDDVEIIVVDDGSTDNTQEIAGGIRGITYIRQENAGLPTTRNNGFAVSRGEYLLFLDSDDRMLPGMGEKVIELFEKYKNVDVIFGDALMGNEKEGYVSWIETYGGQEFFDLAHESPEHGFRIMRGRDLARRMGVINPVVTNGTFMRRSAFERSGKFDTERTGSEDWELWMRMALMDMDFGYTEDKLSVYTRHADSMSADKDYMIKGFAVSLGKILGNRNLSLDDSERAFFAERKKDLTLYYAYLAFDRGDLAEARSRLLWRGRVQGWDAKGSFYFAVSCLPSFFVSAARRLKGRQGK